MYGGQTTKRQHLPAESEALTLNVATAKKKKGIEESPEESAGGPMPTGPSRCGVYASPSTSS